MGWGSIGDAWLLHACSRVDCTEVRGPFLLEGHTVVGDPLASESAGPSGQRSKHTRRLHRALPALVFRWFEFAQAV